MAIGLVVDGCASVRRHPRVRKCFDGAGKRRAYVGIDRSESHVHRVRDAKRADVALLGGRRHVVLRGDWIRHVVCCRRAGHDRERERGVAHRARDRAVDRERLPTLETRFFWDQTERRLVADDTAERRRDAHGATPVGAERDWRHSGSDGCAGPAAGPARRPRQVPRVAGRSEHAVVGGAAVAELGIVGLAHDDRPGSTEPRDGLAVNIRNEVAVGERPVGRQGSAHPDVVLDSDRHAEEWRVLAAADCRIGVAGLRARLVREHDGERVDGGVLASYGVERRLDEFGWRNLARSDRSRRRKRVGGQCVDGHAV